MTTTIYPYFWNDLLWVFDDEKLGLKEEVFVTDTSAMISAFVQAKAIPNAQKGFSLTFSDQSFDGYDAELKWLRPDRVGTGMPGNYYGGEIAGQKMEGWLCPALFLFFPVAPKQLFVKADSLPADVDPIWHVSSDDPRQRRFIGPGEAQ